MDISSKIHELRISKGMTLEDVGNIVGVGKSTIRKWETGMIKNMRRDKIDKLATALGCSPAYLMGWEDLEQEDAFKMGMHDADLLAKYHKLNEKYQKAIDTQIDLFLEMQEQP